MKIYTFFIIFFCFSFTTITFSKNSTSILQGIEGDTVSCFGISDGTLTIFANNGTAPFTYFWENTNGTANGSGLISLLNETITIQNLAAGNYSVTITDGIGTNSVFTTTIASPPLLTLSVTNQTNILCGGTNTGSIILQGNGGTPPYLYSLDGINFTTSTIFSNLFANTYSFTVQDSHGCLNNIIITLSESTTPLGSYISNQINVACFGDSTGQITMVGYGGTPPYLYSLDNGVTTSFSGTFSDLPIGTFSVLIQDANNCSFNYPFSITQPIELTATTTILNNTSSPFSNDGAASITVNGGLPPYTYFWDNGNTNSVVTNLSSGNHCVTITDANGCSIVDCLLIPSAPLLSVSITNDTLSCFGDSNGVFSFMINGGTPPYNYNWIHQATNTIGSGTILNNGGSETVFNLSAGVYLVGIIDALGVQTFDTAFILQPDALTLQISSTNIVCFGDVNGTAIVQPNGGTPVYNYIWNNTATSAFITGLSAGKYIVTVTDLNGCATKDSVQLQAPSQQLVLNLSKIDISCNGANDGQAFATITGGVQPYTYFWSNGATTSSINSLIPGVQAVSVSDAFGCSVTGFVNIVQPFELSTVNTPISDALCFGSNSASAITVPTGGTLPYTFLWSNGQTSSFADSLFAGTSTVTVTDAKGCFVSSSVTLGQPTQLLVSSVDTSVSCRFGNDGAISSFPIGGTPPYNFSWSSNPSTDTLFYVSNLVAGVYKVTITDANGCIFVKRDTVNQPLAINSSFITTPTACNDFVTATGTIQMAITGGNGGYSYIWENGDTTLNVQNLIQGWHTVTISDAKGCLKIDSAYVNAPPLLGVLDTSSTKVKCYNGADGTATIVPQGGISPYFYEWQVFPTQTTPTAINLSAGTYQVVVTDANGCQLDTVSVYVRQPFLPLEAIVSGQNPRCVGSEDGFVSVSPAFGGTPNYQYVWSTGDTAFTVFNVAAGTYEVTITDSKGCIKVKNVTIENPSSVTFSVNVTPVTCFNGYDGIITVLNPSGGAGEPYLYGFNYGIHQADSQFVNLPSGEVQVSVRDRNNCPTDTIVIIPNAAELLVNGGTDLFIELGDSVQLFAQTNTSVPLTYLWQPPLGLSCIDCPNPILIPTLEEQIYSIVVLDSNGCEAIDEIVVTTLKQRRVFIPDVFTPNGDGINDVFVPNGGAGVAGIQSFQVYNRWGELVHQANDFAPNESEFGWDGRINNSVEAPVGVYVYRIVVEFIDNQRIQYTGDVTLVR